MRILLNHQTKTQGYIICDQVRTLDINARKPKFAEKIPAEILEQVKQTVIAVID